MKTEVNESESMVAQLRKIRDQIDIEIQDMNPEQVLEYFNKQQGLFLNSYWDEENDLKPENK